MKAESSTKHWKFDDTKPFPEREFYQQEDRGYGGWGGIYDGDGNPVTGCHEYMVFKDRPTAELIVEAVNFYLDNHGVRCSG